MCRNIPTEHKTLKTIKRRIRSGDVPAHHEKMSSKKHKNYASSSAGSQNLHTVNNNNYFAPLQTVDIDDLDEDHIATESRPKIARNQPLNRRRNLPTIVNNLSNFPNTLRQNTPMQPRVWPQSRENINSTQNGSYFQSQNFKLLHLS